MRRNRHYEVHTEVVLRVWLPDLVLAEDEDDAVDKAQDAMQAVTFDLCTWLTEQANERGFAMHIVDEGSHLTAEMDERY